MRGFECLLSLQSLYFVQPAAASRLGPCQYIGQHTVSVVLSAAFSRDDPLRPGLRSGYGVSVSVSAPVSTTVESHLRIPGATETGVK
ncbi:hypothetical protein BDW74DRAFT_160190 [Aspergillus multicolor]|uniref:uncharacterized protein n=1 Tax=Aspergillus multicolor TaxID=41759 RepID=UPI003CCDD4F3